MVKCHEDSLFQWVVCQVIIYSGGSRNFRSGLHGRILCDLGIMFFNAPSHIPYVFVVRAESRINIVNIVCQLQWKYICMLCSQNLHQKKSLPAKKSKGRPGSAIDIYHIFTPISNWVIFFLTKFLFCSVNLQKFFKKLCFQIYYFMFCFKTIES